MTTLITGSTGQLGAALAREVISRGQQPRCLARDLRHTQLLDGLPVDIVKGDVTDMASLSEACRGVTHIFHVAGMISYWRKRRDEMRRINIQGTQNLLTAATHAGVQRLVLTSSIATLGWVADDQVGDESTPFNWRGIDYCETKYAAEKMTLEWQGLETVAVNPGIILGAGDINQNGAKILLNLNRRQLSMAPCGSVTMANLSDVVDGHLAAMHRGRPKHRYVLGGTTSTSLDFLSHAAALIHAPPPKRIAPSSILYALACAHEAIAMVRRHEPKLTRQLVELSTRNRKYRSSKAKAELGFSPRPIDVGIQACWAWCKDNGLC